MKEKVKNGQPVIVDGKETLDLEALLRKLKPKIRKEFHLIRDLPPEDKVHFLKGYYREDQIFKSGD
jgi:hypothetical protein